MWQGRYGLAVAAARAVSIVSRRAGHAGTALPGLAAERIAPDVVARIAGDLGSVTLISGTNGKTTTSHLLVHILERNGRDVVANRSGANLEQGLAAALVAEAGSRRTAASTPESIGVFEVDEAALGQVAGNVPVSQLVLLNLFRDQLDRFGETDAIVHKWQALVAGLPATATVIFCADDPRLAQLIGTRDRADDLVRAQRTPCLGARRLADPRRLELPSLRREARPDAGRASVTSAGSAAADAGSVDPYPEIGVRVVASRGIDGQTLAFRTPRQPSERSVDVRLPGMSNAYNAAAAVAAAMSVGVAADRAVDALADASPAFGRFEDVEVDGRRVVLTLGKNPASLAELTRVGLESNVSAVLFAVNDGFADGQDVSWFWDVDVSPLLDGRPFAVSGDRAPDFLLRLKYGPSNGARGIPHGFVETADDPLLALDSIVAATVPGGTVLVMATYTALMRTPARPRRQSAAAGPSAVSGSSDPGPIRIVHLFPELLNLYGDRGNVATLASRARWRGFDVEVESIEASATDNPIRADIIFIGGGPDHLQVARGSGARTHGGFAGTGPVRRCGAAGRLWRLPEPRATTTARRWSARWRAGAVRCLHGSPGHRRVGWSVASWSSSRTAHRLRRSAGRRRRPRGSPGQEQTIVGFENHAGRTFLGERVRALGRVDRGHGNNGIDVAKA